jgi:AraC family transcriptional regulator of adaptative response/methylated-DNA-[protein]-cysteine methyltransferase
MATMAVPTSRSDRPRDAAAWRAVQQRDARFDGRFVYAVKTTGVYCRPSCASRQPLRENVEFFSTTDAAERAGFRPCKRCRPGDEHVTSIADDAVARARAFLDANDERIVPLAELAVHAGLSPSHLQRSFKRVVGLSPREYQHARRVRRLKSRLRSGDTVSRATFEAGFGSSSRVYERADDVLGMTPASYRRGGAGVRIVYTIADAPVGRVLVGTTDRGVCAVELGASDAEVERALRSDFPHASLVRNDDEQHAWVRRVLRIVRSPREESVEDVPLDVDGTAFQWRVWKALREIPAGERRSYRDIAQAVGQPSASRAVAQACATNRVAVLIPCHRVVRGDGGLSGYKWGVERKRRLLDAESE